MAAAKDKKRTLFDVTGDMLAFFDLVDEAENDQEVNMILENWFDENYAHLKIKADGYAAVMRELEYRALAREEEAKRLAESARTMRNRASSLKTRFMTAMQFMQMDRLDTDLNSFRICGNGGKKPLDVYDEDKVPAGFIRHIPEIDREAIREALEHNEDVPGAILMERGKHLRIR